MNPTDNTIIRAKLEATDDSKSQQTVSSQGRDGEAIGTARHGLHRPQPYGFSAHPPKGSIGLILMMNGNPDQAVLIGAEHPEHRPTDLGEGEWKQYDQWGGNLHATEAGWVMTVGTLTIHAEQVVINSGDINLGGLGGKPVAVEGTVDDDGDVLVSGFATCVKAV